MPEHRRRGPGLPQRGRGGDQSVVGGRRQRREGGAGAGGPERVASLLVALLGDQPLDGGAEGREMDGAGAGPAPAEGLRWELRPGLEGFRRGGVGVGGGGVRRGGGRGLGMVGGGEEPEVEEGGEVQLHGWKPSSILRGFRSRIAAKCVGGFGETTAKSAEIEVKFGGIWRNSRRI